MDSIVMINKVLGETSRIVDGIEPVAARQPDTVRRLDGA